LINFKRRSSCYVLVTSQSDNVQKDNAKVRKKNESNACHIIKDILPE